MPDAKFNPTVGELPPVLDGWCEAAPRPLVDNFAGFAAGRVDRHCELLQLRFIGDTIRQIARTNEHLGVSKVWSMPTFYKIRTVEREEGK